MSKKPTIDSILFDHESKSYFQRPSAPFEAYDGRRVIMDPSDFPSLPKNINALIVKVGTSVLTHEESERENYNMRCIAEDVIALRKRGMNVMLITSGAIGLGRKARLKRGEKIAQDQSSSPKEKQNDAIVGQPILYERWKNHFGSFKTWEQLVTHEEMRDDYLRDKLFSAYARGMIRGGIPIINENDAKSLEEIEKMVGNLKVFSDNDALAAMHAAMFQKYGYKVLLVGLSNTDGIYTKESLEKKTYLPIRLVRNSEGLLNEADERTSARGRGGMFSKIESAAYAADKGVHVVIANGQYCNHDAPLRRGEEGAVRRYRPLQAILDGMMVGTRFVPSLRDAA